MRKMSPEIGTASAQDGIFLHLLRGFILVVNIY